MNYIFPNPNEKICLVQSKDYGANIHIGKKLSQKSSLYKEIISELELPFHQSVIKLQQCSRNLMNDFQGPNVLYLSNTDGGFVKCGLKLIEDEQIIDYEHLNYVDLLIDEESLKEGKLAIFSHELGHVMMENILKKFSCSKSSKQHVSMGITDYFIAFSEGWAIHFERLAYDCIIRYKELHNLKYNFHRDVVKLWQCEADHELRIRGVLDNVYIHNKMLPGIDTLNLSIADTIILEHTSTIFDKIKLKNAQEMLSCEGVIATLFYRISTNAILQNNYLTRDFYNEFLIKNLEEEKDIRDLFTPFENVILKSLWILYKIQDKLNENSIPFIEFIKLWCESFPEDKEEITRLFICTTVGKTVSNDLAEVYERAAYNGMVGNIKGVREDFNEYKRTLGELAKMIQEGHMKIYEKIGGEIWIENSYVKIPEYLWAGEEMINLKINLNTASICDLMSFPKINMEKAKEIINRRDKEGYFKSVEEIGVEYFK